MKIAYLDGYRFWRILQVGAQAIISNQKELDRINVSPWQMQIPVSIWP